MRFTASGTWFKTLFMPNTLSCDIEALSNLFPLTLLCVRSY